MKLVGCACRPLLLLPVLVLGAVSRVLCMSGKQSTTNLHPSLCGALLNFLIRKGSLECSQAESEVVRQASQR